LPFLGLEVRFSLWFFLSLFDRVRGNTASRPQVKNILARKTRKETGGIKNKDTGRVHDTLCKAQTQTRRTLYIRGKGMQGQVPKGKGRKHGGLDRPRQFCATAASMSASGGGATRKRLWTARMAVSTSFSSITTDMLISEAPEVFEVRVECAVGAF